MPASLAQKESLASNVIWPCDIWSITARDGTVARYASHSRHLTYDGNLFSATPNEPSTSVIAVGLDADTSEMIAVFDDTITKENIEAGKWKRAAIVKEILVDYRNPSLGTVRKQKGYCGRVEPLGAYAFKLEFQSLTSLLLQKTGDLTSNSDRITALADLGIDVTPFTHNTSIMAVTDRRNFQIDYEQPSANYFANGKITWTSGNNNGRSMEIKVATAGGGNTAIELHLPMPSTITIGDDVTAIRGYKLTRADAVAIGSVAVLNSQAEWDIPSLAFTLKYPA